MFIVIPVTTRAPKLVGHNPVSPDCFNRILDHSASILILGSIVEGQPHTTILSHCNSKGAGYVDSHSCEVFKKPFPLQSPQCVQHLKLIPMVNSHFIFSALSIILKQHPPSELMKHADINLTVQGLLPYTGERLYYVIVSIYVYEI